MIHIQVPAIRCDALDSLVRTEFAQQIHVTHNALLRGTSTGKAAPNSLERNRRLADRNRAGPERRDEVLHPPEERDSPIIAFLQMIFDCPLVCGATHASSMRMVGL